MKTALVLLAAVAALHAQRAVEFEQQKALLLENDRIELVMLTQGGAFSSLILKQDPARMNPMWNPIAAARAHNQPPRFGSSIGHFVCVDGFGPTSPEERDAGLQGHGEAHRLPWETVSAGKQGDAMEARFQVTLPIVQEVLRRRIRIAGGESVVLVESELESLLGFDRAINWAEHATIGTPYLVSEKTVVDTSAGRCQVRPNDGRPPRRLASGADFQYPMAPTVDGQLVNTRWMPVNQNSLDHTACAMDPSRTHSWVTALRTDTRLLIGYLWPRTDYPWLQQWMNFAANGNTSWGIEFGTQPYDVPRRQTLEMGSMFDVPAFRILPAKSKLTTRFLMFLAIVPEGFAKVDDVRLENGSIIVEDRTSPRQLKLPSSAAL